MARVDGPEKVRGRAAYVSDIALPNMLWGAIVRSTMPHAEIVRVETEVAARAPGVRAILTSADLPETLTGMVIKDVPLLARKRVRYVGEKIAAVVAETREAADAAASMIDVEYRELPTVFDPLMALEPEAPRIHGESPNYEGLLDVEGMPNTQLLARLGKGDVPKGLAAAGVVVESHTRTAAVHQMHFEPHATVVDAGAGGRVTLYTSNKAPFAVRRLFAAAVGLTEEQVRVVPKFVGGDFGAKSFVMDEPVAYFLSLKTGRPVKILMSYEDELEAGNPRHPTDVTIRLGANSAGKLIALDMRVVLDGGAYGGYKPQPRLPGIMSIGAPYAIESSRVEAIVVYTNQTPGGYMRAPAGPQLTFAVEAAIDLMAKKLAIDPVDLRARNTVTSGVASTLGEVWKAPRAADRLRAAVGDSLRLRRAGPKTPKPGGGPFRGAGVATGEKHVGGGRSGSVVTMSLDGRVRLVTRACDPGTGTLTILRQIVASEVGVDLNDVDVAVGDTDEALFDSGSSGTRVTHVAGRATLSAAQDLGRQLRHAAEEYMEAPAELLRFGGGRCTIAGTRHHVPLATLAAAVAERQGSPPSATAEYESAMTGEAVFVTSVAEVEVDGDTGAVRVVKLRIAQDVGLAINPNTARGQIEGGAIQALGMALSEELRRDRGRAVTVNLHDYKIPAMSDVPEIEVVWVEGNTSPGPYNAKPVGEACVIPTAAAIANAVGDAIGVRITQLPITPEVVLTGLRAR